MSEDINFGAITEALNDKADRDLNNTNPVADYVVESYNDGFNWYRVYKSGWLEQGGKLTSSTSGVSTFSFLKPFSNPHISLTNGIISTDKYPKSVQMQNITSNSFQYVIASDGGTFVQNPFFWYACGQGAEL